MNASLWMGGWMGGRTDGLDGIAVYILPRGKGAPIGGAINYWRFLYECAQNHGNPTKCIIPQCKSVTVWAYGVYITYSLRHLATTKQYLEVLTADYIEHSAENLH